MKDKLFSIIYGVLALAVAVGCFVFSSDYVFMLFSTIPVNLNIVGVVFAIIGIVSIVLAFVKGRKSDAPPEQTETAESISEQEEVPEQEETSEQEVADVQAQKQDGIRVSPGIIAAVVAAFVILLAVLVAVIVIGLKDEPSQLPSDADDLTTETTGDTVAETVEPTVSAGTGLNDATCKGSYTVSDEEAAAAADTVVATMGNRTLTNGELQAHYWYYVRNFYSENAYYLSMLGQDFSQPLDTLPCYFDATLTWQQYFLDEALYYWQVYGSVANAAEDGGYVLTEEDQEYLNTLAQYLEEDALEMGYASAEDMIHSLVGPGADMESYLTYEELFYRSQTYYTYVATSQEYTPEQIEAFFDEHAAEYEANGLTKDMRTVDVRHILIMPEGATSETIRTETFPEEAWTAAKTEAEALLQQWLDGEATEESFGLLANEHSDDGDGTTGGLYEGVYTGQMVANFDAWCFNENRQVGDYEIVETEFGYHIMYFVGSDILWPVYAENDMRSMASEDMLAAALEAYPMEVDYSAIVLGYVNPAE